MQTKKRAKPVKFGGKEKSKKATHIIKPDEAEQIVEQDVEKVEEAESIKTEEPDIATKPELAEESVSSLEHSDQPSNLNEAVKVDSDKEKEEETKPEEHIEEEENNKVEETDPAEIFSIPPDKYENKKSIFPYFLLVTFITFLIGIAFFSGIYYTVKSKAVKFPTFSKPAVSVTTEPKKEVPSPKPIDLSAYTITILNGTDTAGMAAKLKILLTDAGFKVGNTGNADKTDFIKTEIAAKKSVDKKYLEKLKEILGKSYELSSISSLASGTADVVVTIGSASAK